MDLLLKWLVGCGYDGNGLFFALVMKGMVVLM